MQIRYIDLFAGVGGFHYGIDVATSTRGKQGETGESNGNPNNNPGKMGIQQFTCVYSNEWDKYANSVYRRHYGECDIRDIRTVKAEEIPDFDLLCGGFPCQAFSVAGKRGGFEDTRGTLFFEIARIAKEKRPRYLLLENVKGLLNHDQGRTFGVILSTLDELGYDVQWQVLNSKDFGVPQNRERVYIVANLRDVPRPQVFPLSNLNPKTLDYAGGILSEKSKMWLDNGKKFSRNFPQGSRVYKESGISATLASQAGGLGAKTGLYMIDDPSRKRGMIDKNLSPTLRSQSHGNLPSIVNGVRIRKLTPLECERLQGFPDGWTETGYDNEKISDSRRYMMMGNAVTTNVISAIVGKLLCK